jgi:excisionase family DNA binding protein
MPHKIEIGVEPLAVRPRDACTMLGIGLTHLYALIERGEISSYLDGAARKITTSSIREYVERRLEASGSTRHRRPGRPCNKADRPTP